MRAAKMQFYFFRSNTRVDAYALWAQLAKLTIHVRFTFTLLLAIALLRRELPHLNKQNISKQWMRKGCYRV